MIKDLDTYDLTRSEYHIGTDSELSLRHMEPLYSPEGEIALEMYPSDELHQYMQDKNSGFRDTIFSGHYEADAYLQAFLVLDVEKKEAKEIFLAGTDADMNQFEETIKLDSVSRKNGVDMVASQLKAIHMSSIDELWDSYHKFNETLAEVAKKDEKSAVKVNMKPKQEKGLSNEGRDLNG